MLTKFVTRTRVWGFFQVEPMRVRANSRSMFHENVLYANWVIRVQRQVYIPWGIPFD